MAPALRIGYLACTCDSLIAKVGELRKMIDVQGDNIMEQAVLQLIKDGAVKRHIKKSTAHYKTKRDNTAALLQKYMNGKVSFTVPDGGLAFWIVPNKKTDWSKLRKKMQERGIEITTPENYSFNEVVNGIRLGYGSLSEKDLEEGITALAGLL